MNRKPDFVALLALLLIILSGHGAAQISAVSPAAETLRVGAIDFFGYGELNPAKLRESLPVRLGQTISEDTWPSVKLKLVETIKEVTGAEPTDVNITCCDGGGAAMLYVGIAGSSSKPLIYNPAPHGPARLPEAALFLKEKFEEGLGKAVLEGKPQEDYINGYSLALEPTLRTAQLSIRDFTLQHSDLVREVLRSSAAVEHRRLAALFLGYANASSGQVQALVRATRDSDPGVRNNAVRALAVLAFASAKTGVAVPGRPFIDLLSSDKWTDRNKSAMALALMNLTEPRDAGLLVQLRQNAIPALVEMAEWQASIHAGAARGLLARIAGVKEAETQSEIDAIISTARQDYMKRRAAARPPH